MTTDTHISELIQAEKVLTQARKDLEKAKADHSRMAKRAASTICPLKEGQRVAIEPGILFHVGEVDIAVDAKKQTAQWSCYGQTVRFEHGRALVSPTRKILTQEQFEATPPEVLRRTAEQMKQDSLAKAHKASQRKLTLGEGHMAMLAHCLDGHEEGSKLRTKQVPRGMVWSTSAGTDKIWRDLVVRGVLAITSGKLEGTVHDWQIAPGERFDEAVKIMHDARLARRQHHRAMRP